MSRDAMRELKAKTDEAARVKQEAAQEKAQIQREAQRLFAINSFVTKVYHHAVEAAKSKADTSYKYSLGPMPDFYLKNMPDILAGLQGLFPGCNVSHTQSHIVVDWS